MERLQGYPTCFACGHSNPQGLRLELYRDGGKVRTTYRLSGRYAGFPGVAHGGILATLLDEVMTWAAIEVTGQYCVTGELKVRYLKPAPVEEELQAWGETVGRRRRFAVGRGQVEGPDGTLLARGEGKFFLLPEGTLPKAVR